MDQVIQITLTATGARESGKSTVLNIAKEALEKAGFKVSKIHVYGEDVIREVVTVTTATIKTERKWLKY
jgi:molybdopterin-guanine dinucleotide biosynthesis protein